MVSTRGISKCVDVRVPSHDSYSVPRISFVDDTLFVLDHSVSSDTAIAEISKYHIRRDMC